MSWEDALDRIRQADEEDATRILSRRQKTAKRLTVADHRHARSIRPVAMKSVI